jgi:hypothetical protein
VTTNTKVFLREKMGRDVDIEKTRTNKANCTMEHNFDIHLLFCCLRLSQFFALSTTSDKRNKMSFENNLIFNEYIVNIAPKPLNAAWKETFLI